MKNYGKSKYFYAIYLSLAIEINKYGEKSQITNNTIEQNLNSCIFIDTVSHYP